MKTYFIETWGCQMNELDTQRLSGNLKLRGYKRVDEAARAAEIPLHTGSARGDAAPRGPAARACVTLLNACSVRDKAEQKVYSQLGRLRELKAQRDVKIGVA